MNVFVLSTGRCGSLTFAKACEHITNFTSAHESKSDYARSAESNAIPYQSLTYPGCHIEIDNRLSWFLGGLDKTYGRDTYYVHLMRDRDLVARSYARRWHKGIMMAFASGILTYSTRVFELPEDRRHDVACLYWEVGNDNIR